MRLSCMLLASACAVFCSRATAVLILSCSEMRQPYSNWCWLQSDQHQLQLNSGFAASAPRCGRQE